MNNTPRIEKVAALEGHVHAWDWPFARTHASEIAAHWAKRVAAQPRLFNGRVLLQRACRIVEDARGRVFQSDWFETDFAAFLAWQDFGFPDASVRNVFSAAALRSADGAYLLGRMGAHTANAGCIYFAAGTPDPDDVTGDRLDLEASAIRELAEESGILARELALAPEWALVFDGPRIACLKPMTLNASTDEILTRVHAYLAQDPEPELADFLAVRSESDIDPDHMPGFILTYLRDALRNGLR